jgi:hypothetical protein
MMIEVASSKKAVRRTRRNSWVETTRLCIFNPLKQGLYRRKEADNAYYLGTRLGQRLVAQGTQHLVSRTRTTADPFDVVYHVSPCC